MTPGILSAFHHANPSETKIRLVYFDSSVDGTIPSNAAAQVNRWGMFDSYGLDTLRSRVAISPV